MFGFYPSYTFKIIATRYGLDSSRFQPRWGRDLTYPFRKTPRPTQPTVQGVQELFPGLKRPGWGVDYPPHLAPRIELYVYSPVCTFMVCKREIFTFTIHVKNKMK
jgi:hypothetical protein